jgi:DNA-binding LacI/PurR family transcriptional regulator
MEVCVSRMLQRKVDGVAIMTSEMDERLITEFESRGIPLVFLDTGNVRELASNIVVDYAAGVRAAMEHLLELGHTEIAFIAGPATLQSARVRCKAFVTAMEEKGLDASVVEQGNHQVDGGHDAMERLLARKRRPTAVLASNDMTAIGALGTLHEAGVRVPEEVSIAGFDDIALSAFTQPALTTVKLSREEIARLAFRALFNIRQEGGLGSEFTVKPTLVVRDSTSSVQGRSRRGARSEVSLAGR